MERHKSPKELENESNIEKLKAEVLEMYAKEREKEREEAIENYFSHKDLKFVNEYIVFLTQLNLYLNHFPRHEKFALSSQIRNRAYEVYELMIQSRKKWHKKTSLTNLDMSLELLKMDIYLAYKLGYFDYSKECKEGIKGAKRYGILQLMLSKIGAQVGAWIKVARENENW